MASGAQRVDIGAYKARFKGRLGVFKRGVLLKLFGAVIKDTPVLTGRLRANWRFGLSKDVLDTTVLEPDEGGQQLLSLAQDISAKVTDKDDTYVLVNNLPYVNRIEYEAWSHTKAPRGMVRINLLRIANILRQQVSESPSISTAPIIGAGPLRKDGKRLDRRFKVNRGKP